MMGSDGEPDPCHGKFAFSADPNVNVIRIYAPDDDGNQKDVTIKFCGSGDSVANAVPKEQPRTRGFGAVIDRRVIMFVQVTSAPSCPLDQDAKCPRSSALVHASL